MFDETKRGFYPALELRFLAGLQLAEAQVEHNGDDEQTADDDKERTKQEASVRFA
jgi:hypothetical protein